MDPISPISSGSAAISRVNGTPVERLELVARERDRSAKERQERNRRESTSEIHPESSLEDEDGRPHVDVRV